MERDDIFRLAESFNTLRTEWVFNEVKLQQFFRAAYRAGVAAEREACAQVCDKVKTECEEGGVRFATARVCAKRIRARGEK